ncbi:UNVERIFIED_ORG: hypothetical protein GGI66_003629 [Rhizobium esperanzae]
MITMDIFNDDAFSATSLTAAVDKVGYVPNFLDAMPGLFDPVPVRTEAIWIESRANEAALIQTTARGAPIDEKSNDDGRDARAFRTRRLFGNRRIRASELFGIRAFNSETELKAVQTEVAYRQGLIKRDFALTRENLKLGCIQGIVTDADGTTIYNWANELGQTIPAEVDFDLDNASPADGALRKRCTAAIRSMQRGLKGAVARSFMAICGDAFWDDLTAHPEVRATYLQTQAAAALREPLAWETFNFGGITWTNYRGTDDNSTVAVNTDKAKFFPVGAGIFKWAMSPGETFDDIGTLGQDFYSMMVLDEKRNTYADVEVYSYPLPVCTLPQALYRAKRT